MGIHNICFHEEIRKISKFIVEKSAYLGLWSYPLTMIAWCSDISTIIQCKDCITTTTVIGPGKHFLLLVLR